MRFKSCALGLAIMLAYCPFAGAVAQSLDLSQYAHTTWRIRDGFAKGNITSIAQTSDGYLWVGTDLGLLRFDGVRAVPWRPPGGKHRPGKELPIEPTVLNQGTTPGTGGHREAVAPWPN